jgi:UDP-N-acetylmuramate--alanine ligase
MRLLYRTPRRNGEYNRMLLQKCFLRLRALSGALIFMSTHAEHLVVDEYAHNPHKIASMMQAVQLIRLALCYLFQPHGYGPTRMMKNEYIAAFAENLRASDHLILLPIYYAGGTAQKDISSDEIARGVAVQGKSAESVTTRKEVLDRIAEWQNYIIFGARERITLAFAASIADKIRQRT